MTERSSRRFYEDDRGSVPLQLPISGSTLFTSLVAAVLGLPLVAALGGAFVRREHAFQFVFTAAAALVAVFTLTGMVQFAPRWAVLGILAIVAAIAAHVWQFRHDRLDLVIVGSIYVMPLSLASVLLVQVVGSVL